MKNKKNHQTINTVCSRIAPVWPLENSVAVNPFLGLADMDMERAANVLSARGGIRMYMPLGFYLELINKGEIQSDDMVHALQKKQMHVSVNEFIQRISQLEERMVPAKQVHTVSVLAEDVLGIAISELLIHHTSTWMAHYFNLPAAAQTSESEMFAQWCQDVKHDLFPDLSGLKGFRNAMKSVPTNYNDAIDYAIHALSLNQTTLETYTHAILLKLLGWSSYCAGLDWQHKLYVGNTHFVKALLAMLMNWEAALLSIYRDLKKEWNGLVASDNYAVKAKQSDELIYIQSILQYAFDLAGQRVLSRKFEHRRPLRAVTKERPIAQMIFCIDVRSEVYRRTLEGISDQIKTLGFAGFFGFPLKYNPLLHTNGKNQCPVLIPSGPQVIEQDNTGQENKTRKLRGRIEKAWLKFKLGSVSSYSFVSPLGMYFLPKLIGDTMGWTTPTALPKSKEFGSLLTGKTSLDLSAIPFEERLAMAASAITAMGLKEFAPLVLITGHGSSSINNPHAAGLDCGACGGNSGEINALAAQLILNDTKIRAALKLKGIQIPKDTLFLACLHDTTTDKICFLQEQIAYDTHANQLQQVQGILQQASSLAREKRAERLGIKNQASIKNAVLRRANDWSQVRPEWGLAGCNAFVVAPRTRTLGVDLEGKAFLHSYSWQDDSNFGVLETIMTAPMIVTSWINLQYYASTVDNDRLGAGNKTLHNVTSGLGVFEGAGGDLRIGLPLQSVHDGNQYQHMPQRLNVIIEAPLQAVNDILEKHSNVKQLCDNEWILLLLMNHQGQISHRYTGDLQWEQLDLPQQQTRNSEKVELAVY